jgi:hypothetical protein
MGKGAGSSLGLLVSSALILLILSFGIRYSLTEVTRKVVLPWGSASIYDSPFMAMSLYGPF